MIKFPCGHLAQHKYSYAWHLKTDIEYRISGHWWCENTGCEEGYTLKEVMEYNELRRT